MKKRVYILFYIILSIISINLILVSAVIINVPGDHSTIGAAVGNASNGDTINVTGIFNESVLVNTSVSIIGNNATIHSTNVSFNISANNVLIRNFNIFVVPGSKGAVFVNNNNSNLFTGTKVIFNNFIGGGNGTGIAINNTIANASSLVNATFNFFGICTGPANASGFGGSNVTGNVTFAPFIGICINNKTNVSCSFENKNANLSANVNGSFLNTVIFSYTINGTNFNKTGSKTPGSLTNYFYEINFSQLVGGKNITWNVYVNDSFGNNFSDGLQSFYVANRTILNITPANPNGLAGWYVVEPNFSLIRDAAKLRSYYRWNSIAEVLFTAIFNLDGIPNQPKISAGTLELKYWSEFSCGNETKQNQILYIDLVAPEIKNLVPANNSIVFNNPRPTIQALLDEVYHSNSGINKGSVYMRLDGGGNLSINVLDSGSIDAIVRHNPITNLAEGLHNVTVYVEDNAGRSNRTTWFFTINTSTGDFNLTVNSPNGSYGIKKIPFNITTTKIVNNITYINYNDKTPRIKVLCRNCDEYGFSREQFITLNEGRNNITIKAANGFGNTKQVNVSVFVDSKLPIISKILPVKNSITNGSNFSIKYSEDNLQKISISYNPSKNLSSCASGINKICSINLNLTSFNGQRIKFSFNISDSIRTVQSREINVIVDTSKPVLTIYMPQNKTGSESYNKSDGVLFNISISEMVRLEFFDNFDINPKWKNLCSNCDEYGFNKKKTKSFETGIHNILIRAVDDAGNSNVRNVKFEVVSL